jgi:peptide deformylase|tara:strand:+ start:148 stop:735 length:588 start_codon:yes stop_codon:yes gene_type:complete
MSDIFTIDTEEGIVKEKEEIVEPLSLFDESHPMLLQRIPEYDVTRLPNPVLGKLIKRLKMTMKLHGGIGLSANQCGIFERVFVLGANDAIWACINPKIINASPDLIRDKEGCLSFPGLALGVERHSWVEAEFINEECKVVQMRFEGLTARCFQHELDHMNGIKFTSKVKPLALQMAKKQQQKLIKKIMRLKKQYG